MTSGKGTSISKAVGFLALLAAIASPLMDHGAHADTDTAIGGQGLHGKRSVENLQKLSSDSDNAESVRGFCFVGEGPTNPIPGPCVNLLLILNDTDGNEVSRARTSSQGAFEFSSEKGKSYKIVSGSKFYDVVAPKQVKSGDRINVQLQQK